MSLRDLPTQTMVSLSAAWLDPAHARSAIEALPTARAMLPKIDAAHRLLLKTQPDRSKPRTPPALAALQVEQAEIDDVHDRNARGLYNVLTGFADLSEDDDAAVILTLRDKIFPPDRGLSVIKMSYADEAGEAALVEKRLNDEDRAFLKTLPMPDGSLFDAHRTRVQAGKKLGELEQQRVELESRGADPGSLKQGDALQARNGWIKAVRALVVAIDLDEPKAPVRKRILSPLDDAERKAAQRRASKVIDEAEPVEQNAIAAEGDAEKPA